MAKSAKSRLSGIVSRETNGDLSDGSQSALRGIHLKSVSPHGWKPLAEEGLHGNFGRVYGNDAKWIWMGACSKMHVSEIPDYSPWDRMLIYRNS